MEQKEQNRESKWGKAEWDRRAVKNRAFRSLFKRHFRTWLAMVFLCFIFAFIGAEGHGATSWIGDLDTIFGFTTVPEQDIEALRKTAADLPVIKDMPTVDSELTKVFLARLYRKYSWMLHAFSKNAGYFKRNTKEVLGLLLFAWLLSFFWKLFVQNTLVIGKYRYFLESRQQNGTRFRRALAPFHKKTLWRTFRTLITYHIVLILWSFTIIGGFYFVLAYAQVPWIVAENPEITWREARDLSRKMMDGYKWKYFVTKLSIFYVYLISVIPIVGNVIASPYLAVLNAELYMTLRGLMLPDELPTEICVERLFDRPACVDLPEEEREENLPFVLETSVVSPEGMLDGSLRKDGILGGPYRLTDFILMFFIFCFIGWCWEVLLEYARTHRFVNRGSLHGPWLPIYGTGGTIFIFLFTTVGGYFQRKKLKPGEKIRSHPIRTFFLIMLIAGILEYFTSWGLDFFSNASYWNYSKMFLNINGRICLVGLIAFGVLGEVAIYVIGPLMARMFHKCNRTVLRVICVILIGFFVADLVYGKIYGMNKGAGIGGTVRTEISSEAESETTGTAAV